MFAQNRLKGANHGVQKDHREEQDGHQDVGHLPVVCLRQHNLHADDKAFGNQLPTATAELRLLLLFLLPYTTTELQYGEWRPGKQTPIMSRLPGGRAVVMYSCFEDLWGGRGLTASLSLHCFTPYVRPVVSGRLAPVANNSLSQSSHMNAPRIGNQSARIFLCKGKVRSRCLR